MRADAARMLQEGPPQGDGEDDSGYHHDDSSDGEGSDYSEDDEYGGDVYEGDDGDAGDDGDDDSKGSEEPGEELLQIGQIGTAERDMVDIVDAGLEEDHVDGEPKANVVKGAQNGMQDDAVTAGPGNDGVQPIREDDDEGGEDEHEHSRDAEIQDLTMRVGDLLLESDGVTPTVVALAPPPVGGDVSSERDGVTPTVALAPPPVGSHMSLESDEITHITVGVRNLNFKRQREGDEED
ncbi:hypothetical protein HK104_008742, partial [Borealophlyctis nickersoniae]